MEWWWFRLAFLVCIVGLAIYEWNDGGAASSTIYRTLAVLLAIVYVASANVAQVRRAAATE